MTWLPNHLKVLEVCGDSPPRRTERICLKYRHLSFLSSECAPHGCPLPKRKAEFGPALNSWAPRSDIGWHRPTRNEKTL